MYVTKLGSYPILLGVTWVRPTTLGLDAQLILSLLTPNCALGTAIAGLSKPLPFPVLVFTPLLMQNVPTHAIKYPLKVTMIGTFPFYRTTKKQKLGSVSD